MTDTEAQPADPSASQPTEAPIAGPVSELPEDAIEAAAKALATQDGDNYDGSIYGADPAVLFVWGDHARAALAAALPFLERATRDKIAAEIGAYPDAPATSSERFKVGFHEMRAVAARVARGGEATE